MLDEIDRALILATQDGLPLVPQPYHVVAAQLGIAPAEVMARLQHMLENGVVRRIGAVPNHYRLGYTANGMTVWDVPDEVVDAAGARVGALTFVSHCYRRPRYEPDWPYCLFAMVHGRDRSEVNSQVARIADVLGEWNRGHRILYSTQILKKSGLRLHGHAGGG